MYASMTWPTCAGVADVHRGMFCARYPSAADAGSLRAFEPSGPQMTNMSGLFHPAVDVFSELLMAVPLRKGYTGVSSAPTTVPSLS